MIDLKYEMAQLDRRFIWLSGEPAELWLAEVRFVADLIKRYDIEVTDPGHLTQGGARLHEMQAHYRDEELAREFVRPQPFPGGKRIPHLHFKGDFYALNEEQWAEFSGAMVERFRAKLEGVGTVPFTKMMELGDAIETM